MPTYWTWSFAPIGEVSSPAVGWFFGLAAEAKQVSLLTGSPHWCGAEKKLALSFVLSHCPGWDRNLQLIPQEKSVWDLLPNSQCRIQFRSGLSKELIAVRIPEEKGGRSTARNYYFSYFPWKYVLFSLNRDKLPNTCTPCTSKPLISEMVTQPPLLSSSPPLPLTPSWNN